MAQLSTFSITGSLDWSQTTENTSSVGYMWFDGSNFKYSTYAEPQIGAWSQSGNIITARQCFAGASQGNNSAGLVFGGRTNSNLSCTEEYNGASWSSGGALPVPLFGNAGAGTQNAGLSIGGTPTTQNAYEYNGSSWSTGGNMVDRLTRRTGFGTQNAALATGGFTSSPSPFSHPLCTEEYNGTAWSAGGSLITGLSKGIGTGTQNAGLAFGSCIFAGAVGPADNQATKEYNGTAWSAGGNLIQGGCDLGGAGTQNAALAFGGAGSPVNRSSCTEKYNGTSWSTDQSLITGRCAASSQGNTTGGALVAAGCSTSLSKLLLCTEEYILNVTSSIIT